MSNRTVAGLRKDCVQRTLRGLLLLGIHGRELRDPLDRLVFFSFGGSSQVSTRRVRDIFAAGIIETGDKQLLIARPDEDESEQGRLWIFPRGEARRDESPEGAMRRMAKADLGIGVDVLVGQPPVPGRVDGKEVEMRYFFCAVIEGEAKAGPYAEIRWIPHAHLCEYDFDDNAQPVADWLKESP